MNYNTTYQHKDYQSFKNKVDIIKQYKIGGFKMIDLNKIVNETLANLAEEKFVEKVVKERLEKTITEIVDDVFREYGEFGIKLKDYIENNLNVNLERLGL
ncbi:hypothetical protein HMPREF3222_03278, partial [Clostridium perfringens]